MLSLTGQYPWPSYFPIPIEIVLLPPHFPINFYDFSVYGRANIAPILILANKKYVKTTKRSPDLSELLSPGNKDEFFDSEDIQELFALIGHDLQSVLGLPQTISLRRSNTQNNICSTISSQMGLFTAISVPHLLMIFALVVTRSF